MSKQKRATIGKTPGTSPSESGVEESADDAAVKDDMVHVTPDLLAGSPDIFAGKRTEAGAARGSGIRDRAVGPRGRVRTNRAHRGEHDACPRADDLVRSRAACEPCAPVCERRRVPRPLAAWRLDERTRHRARRHRYLRPGGRPFGRRLHRERLAPVHHHSRPDPDGGRLRQHRHRAPPIPGGILTMLGVVLAYTSSTGDWPFWAYGWALVTPFGIGLGMYLQALRDHDQVALRTGRSLLAIGVMIFLVGFVLFESILGISGRDYFGPAGKAALPLLLILVGVILLARSIQRAGRPRVLGPQPGLQLLQGHLVLDVRSVGLESHGAVDRQHRPVRVRVLGHDPSRVRVELADVEHHRRLHPLAQAASARVRSHAGELLIDQGAPVLRQVMSVMPDMTPSGSRVMTVCWTSPMTACGRTSP